MLEVHVWPLPKAVVAELAQALRDATIALLKERKIVSGAVTELPLVPPGSKPN